ncbi:MAG: heavy metal translocating P-type ATPase [Candidatus Competibacterales bacterium]
MLPLILPLVPIVASLGGGLYVKHTLGRRREQSQSLVAPEGDGKVQEKPPESSLDIYATALEQQLSAMAGALQFERLTQYFLDKIRSKHLQQALNTEGEVEGDISPHQLESDRRLGVATVNIGVTLGGLFYTPLYILTIPMLGYLFIPIYHHAYRELVDRRKVGIAFLDSVFLTGALVGRFFLPLALGTWLIEISGNLLARTEDSSRKKLSNVFGELPKRVWVLRDGVELEIPLQRLTVDDVVLVTAGQTIPVDGTILQGNVSVDQHMLTGESQPVEKTAGDGVMASTNLISGSMQIKVERTGEETRAAQIVQVLENTSAFTGLIQARGIKIAEQAVIPTLALSAVGLPIVGPSGSLALLTTSFGYNLRVVSPISMLNFLQISSERKILIKDGRSLERLSDIDTVVFDKTGTLTLDQPTVGELYTAHGMAPETLLRYAAAAERRQTHPIARAILAAAQDQELDTIQVEDSKYDIGYGITVRLDDRVIRVGSRRFMDLNDIAIPAEIEVAQHHCNENGYSLIYVAIDGDLGGAIEMRPTIRPEAKRVIAELKRRKVDMYIISGDHERPTRKLAQELGIEHYFAETLPENKADLVAGLQREGRKVCFIGDGINDSIALKRADVSISLLGATTVATDTAHVVFMDESLEQLNFLFVLGDEYKVNMRNSLLTTVIPGGAVIGGVFLLGMGIFGGVLIYNLGLAAGVINAVLPRWRFPRVESTTYPRGAVAVEPSPLESLAPPSFSLVAMPNPPHLDQNQGRGEEGVQEGHSLAS